MKTRSVAGLMAFVFCCAAQAGTADSGTFERVYPTEYRDMLRDAARAYGGKRYDDAFRQFQRAACAGDKQSQSALGRMYLLGQGVERNDLTGYAWLKVAAEVVFPGYQEVARRLEEAMTAEQRRIAGAQAKTLIDEYGIAATGMSCNKSASMGGHISDQIVCTPRQEGNRLLLKRCVDAATH